MVFRRLAGVPLDLALDKMGAGAAFNPRVGFVHVFLKPRKAPVDNSLGVANCVLSSLVGETFSAFFSVLCVFYVPCEIYAHYRTLYPCFGWVVSAVVSLAYTTPYEHESKQIGNTYRGGTAGSTPAQRA